MNGLITTTTLRNNLSGALKEVTKNKKYLLVTKGGNPISALVNLDFFEDLLALLNPKYLKSIKDARSQYRRKEKYTFEEVFGKL